MADLSPEADRIEAGIARTRARMDHRLDQLQDHLSPKQMLNDAFAYFRGGEGADITQQLIDRVRANPLPLAVVGVGIAWLMATSVSTPNAQLGVNDDARKMHQELPTGSPLLSDAVHSPPPEQGNQTMAHSARETISSLSHNPFALGAIAAMIGAVAGALLPTLEQEEAALGGTATKIREQGRDLAQDVVNRGSRVASETLDAVKDSAEAHGLTGEKSLGDAAAQLRSGNLIADAKAVAHDALEAGKGSVTANMAASGEAPVDDHKS